MKRKFFLLALLLTGVYRMNAQLPCNAAFTYSVNPSGLVNFSVTNPVGTSTAQYYWDFGMATDTGVNASYTYNTTGTFTVCLTVVDSTLTYMCWDTSCQNITITSTGGGSSCNASFVVVPDTGGAPHTYLGYNLSSGTGLTYTWVWGDGSPNGSGPYPSHTYPAAGYYNICLVVMGGGCIDSFCLNQLINKTTGTDMYTINFVAPAGIQDVKKSETLPVYPNPADQMISLGADVNTNYQVSIYSIGGQCMQSVQVRGAKEFSIANLPSGFYTMNISAPDGKRYFARFMKQ
ncbi:MAG TPA: PKD domain-containing protein [Chitinophagaceae bacterium]|nr:PKD domain-containing protein [Chitinophagaceae bacterium]HNF72131.1 PKD domain-containing protein [Chitinophagaceae bacterium]